MIVVCPLRHLERVIAAYTPSHVITLLAPDAEIPACPSIPDAGRLILKFNDIIMPEAGLIAPDSATVETILGFGAEWDSQRPLLVHCLAGISRSTAAAYILACSLTAPGSEQAVASRLRLAAPSATPNSLMVSLADGLLGREGRMIAAISKIGRGATAFEGEPFDLDFP
jgi:predicted protein tyrosine phosphatase